MRVLLCVFALITDESLSFKHIIGLINIYLLSDFESPCTLMTFCKTLTRYYSNALISVINADCTNNVINLSNNSNSRLTVPNVHFVLASYHTYLEVLHGSNIDCYVGHDEHDI